MCWAVVVHSLLFPARSRAEGVPTVTIVYAAQAERQEQLAAREIRRYIYLRTRELPRLERSDRLPDRGDAILVGQKRRPLVAGVTTRMCRVCCG